MWPDSEDTQQLIDAAHAGRADAVNRLLEQHREAVRRFIHLRMDRALSRRVDASDIVQDVLLEASVRLSDFLKEPRLPFALWLRQLAKDRIIDMHRRHRVAQRRSVDHERPLAATGLADRSSWDLAAQIVDPELTPAAANIRKELERRFWTAVNELDEDDREVVLMRHCEHLGNREVALALNISEAAAGMRHLRALRRLRALLDNEPIS